MIAQHQAIASTNTDLIDWTPRNKLQWNLSQSKFNDYIQENTFENVVYKMVAILIVPSNAETGVIQVN